MQTRGLHMLHFSLPVWMVSVRCLLWMKRGEIRHLICSFSPFLKVRIFLLRLGGSGCLGFLHAHLSCVCILNTTLHKFFHAYYLSCACILNTTLHKCLCMLHTTFLCALYVVPDNYSYMCVHYMLTYACMQVFCLSCKHAQVHTFLFLVQYFREGS